MAALAGVGKVGGWGGQGVVDVLLSSGSSPASSFQGPVSPVGGPMAWKEAAGCPVGLVAGGSQMWRSEGRCRKLRSLSQTLG